MKILKALHKLKTLKILIQLDLALLTFMGWSATFGYSRSAKGLAGIVWSSSGDDPDPVLKLLGMGMFLLGGLLLFVNELVRVGSRRQFARWLAAANLGIAVTAFIQGTGRHPIEWSLLLAPLIMAILLAWASNYPLKPGETTAELAKLRIPDEVRQALLLQVGEAAAQEERNRLARDLHDSIKQQLFTISVSAATAQERWERDPEGARAALADVRRSAREAMVEMQAMLHQLRPQALTSTAGLVEALREQVEALGYRSGAQVTVELGPEIPDDRMPPGAQEALFRIAQETLANVARHARAGRVRVWIGQEGEEALLRVEDDGQGFDPKAAVSGMGLRNLQERAVALRGRVEIESKPGAGSTVTARIPLLSPPASAVQARGGRASFGSLVDGFVGPLILISLIKTSDPGIVDIVVAALFFGGAIALRAWGAKSWRDSESRRVYLRFETHREAAALFFAAAARMSPFWFSENAPTEGISFWTAGALFCLVLSLLELAAFRRWSEWRLTLPPSNQVSFILGCLVFSGIFISAILGAIGDLALVKIVILALMGAGGLFMLCRQSRPEGALA
jgi:signal transduction histidine kinase